MANVHAYKIVYALKEIAEDLLYSPEDIISDADLCGNDHQRRFQDFAAGTGQRRRNP